MPAKQRRYTRLKTRELARLTLPDGRRLDCEVHDFCQKGLSLVLLDRGASPPPLAAEEQTVVVEFPNKDTPRKGPYSLQAKIVHSSAAGIGLFVDGIPQEAYEALLEARYKIIPPDQPVSDLLPEETQAILQDCVNVFRVFLAQAWRGFLKMVESKTEERDASPLPLVDHSRYLAGLEELLRRSTELNRLHFSNLAQRMHRLGEDRGEVVPEGMPTELAVVDEDSFEDWLNLSGVANRIEIDNRSAMYQFAQRFGRLLPVNIAKHNDPFGPDAVCQAFQEVLGELDLNNAMRGLIYRMFGSALAEGYPQLYDDLGRLLRPVTPLAAPSLRGGRGTAPTTAEESEADRIAGQVAKLAAIADRLFSMQAPPAASIPPLVADEIDPLLAPAVPPTAVAQAPSEVPARPVAAPISAADAARTRSLDQLERTLWQIAGRIRTGLPGATAGGAAAIGLDQVLAHAVGSGLTPTASLTERLNRALESGQFPQGLPEARGETLGMATHLVGRALDEHPAQSDIDMLLRKLERPLYECVLSADEGLPNASHPLRRLFNLVDRFAVAADDDGRLFEPKLRELLPLILDRAVAQGASNSEGYAQACETLEKLLKTPERARRQRVTALQGGCESQEHLRRARRRVGAALREHFGGAPVPRLLLRLLDGGWHQYLLFTALRGDPAAWERALALLDVVAARSSAPGQTQPAGGENHLQVVNAIEDCLKSVSIDRRQIASLVEDLIAYLDGLRPDFAADLAPIPAVWVTGEAEDDGSSAHGNLPNQLRLGDWWDFTQDTGKVPMQLIWLSHDAANCAFANRSATRKVDLGLAELARQAAEGRAARSEDRDLPLLERSEYSIVDGMYQRLMHKASHDPVTGLLNRKGLLHALETYPLAGMAQAGGHHQLAIIAFDPFRMIHDRCGIEASDRLSVELADLLRRIGGARDVVAILEHGSFAVFLPGLGESAARQVADRLRRDLHAYRFTHGPDSYAIDARIGIADYAPELMEATEALRRAGAACTAALGAGREPVRTYAQIEESQHGSDTLADWAGRLDAILERDQLFLRCQKVQPLLDAERPAYYEILLGLHDAQGTLVSPQAFVQAGEQWNRAHDIDLWVITRTFAWIRANPAAFSATGGFSINLSAHSLAHPDVLAALHRELSSGDLPSEKVIFEITETAALFSYAPAQDFIQQIRRYGCRFCIDDFGSGNASYTYLRHLRPDTLKIDGAYVRDMLDDPDLRAMVKSMNDIGHSLGMHTVAEYVATPEILAVVRELGVDYAQGYCVHKPVPIDQLITGV